MFIINLTYTTELTRVDHYLNEHIDYLNNQYEQGNFLVSGRKVPRTGGIILSSVSNKEELEKIITKDPFNINNLARYEIIEFVPSKTCKELRFLTES